MVFVANVAQIRFVFEIDSVFVTVTFRVVVRVELQFWFHNIALFSPMLFQSAVVNRFHITKTALNRPTVFYTTNRLHRT